MNFFSDSHSISFLNSVNKRLSRRMGMSEMIIQFYNNRKRLSYLIAQYIYIDEDWDRDNEFVHSQIEFGDLRSEYAEKDIQSMHYFALR